jgi:hypothetical protein
MAVGRVGLKPPPHPHRQKLYRNKRREEGRRRKKRGKMLYGYKRREEGRRIGKKKIKKKGVEGRRREMSPSNHPIPPRPCLQTVPIQLPLQGSLPDQFWAS